MKVDYKKVKDAVITALAGTAAVGVFNFYFAWKEDEAVEELEQKPLMFDDVQQKAHTLNTVEQVDPSKLAVKLAMDSVFQSEVLRSVNQIKKDVSHMDSLRKLDADQIYQIKEEIKRNNENN